MKIKYSSEKVSSTKFVGPFIAVLVAGVILRGYQMLNLIDPTTGFFESSNITIALLYGLILISCIIFIVVSYLSKDSLSFEISSLKSKSACAVSAVFGIVMILDALASFLAADSEGHVESTYITMMSNGSLPYLLRAVFAALSSLYLFILASSFKKGDGSAAKHKILALAPVAWSAFRMFGLFVKKISFLRVSDLFLELVMLSLMAVFFIGFAQNASGVYSDGSSWRIPAFGTSAALVAGIVSVTRLIFTFVNGGKYINKEYPACVTDLIFAAFVIIIVCVLSKNIKKAKTEQLTEETTQ